MLQSATWCLRYAVRLRRLGRRTSYQLVLRRDLRSLQDVDVLLLAHVLEYLWPHGDADLSQVRLV